MGAFGLQKKKKKEPVLIGVIGGSGVYEIEGLRVLNRFYPTTPFGKPSDPITIGELKGVRCAFLPRHGKGHRFLPSEIPQKANIYALKMLGVEFIIGISACGSLQEKCAPLDFLIPDQIIDRTKGRESTFFGEGIVAHISFHHPFASELSKLLIESSRRLGIKTHDRGTYLCMEGPAFSTKAESFMHQKMGCDVIGMTAIPEAKLAREAEMSYALLALITDYDCWKEDQEVTAELVLQNLKVNVENAKKVVADVLPRISTIRNQYENALRTAIFTSPEAMKPTTKKKLSLLIGKYIKP